jgi:hypothetical protein
MTFERIFLKDRISKRERVERSVLHDHLSLDAAINEIHNLTS